MESCDTAKVLEASAVDGADSAAAASKQQDAEKQPNQANNQAEEEEAAPAPVPLPARARVDAFASDSEDDEDDDAMSSLEYILTYKELPQFEVDLIMSRPVKRTPFADSEVFKHLFAANPSTTTTQEEIDKARDEYEENLNTRARFHEYVRSEYEAKGYVAVSDEYIDRRVYVEEFSRKLWEGFSVSGRERGD